MRMSTVSFALRCVASTLAAAALVACNDNDDAGVTTTYGTAQALGNGSARSFVTLDGAGAPTAIGVTISEDALASLPATEAPTVLPLPAQAASATVFDHLSLDWEPAGHEPAGLYDRPHFDVHFYLISQAQRQAIGFAPDEPAPVADAIAQDYVSGQTVVPAMGQHWFDPTDPNNTPGNFSYTFIYGYHQGSMVFLEPMVTRAMLLSRNEVSTDIKQPKSYPKPGYYPTHYSIRFDEAARAYVVTLDKMVQR